MNCATHNDVAALAYCRTCGKPLCANCTRSVQGVIYCEPCLAARMQGVPTAPPPRPDAPPPSPGVQPQSGPNPVLAGILGAIPFGVGAVYTGQYVKGLIHLGIFVALIVGFGGDWPWPVYAALGIGMAFFVVYQIIDAINSAKALQMGQPAPDPFHLTQTFGTGEKIDTAKIPTAAIVLIGLGLLFLLSTVGIFDLAAGMIWPLFLIGLGVWLFAKRWGIVGRAPVGCSCERCRTRGLMGPALLLTVGLIALVSNTTHVGWGHLWPFLLIVIGVVKVWQSHASTEGHVEVFQPGVPGVPPPPPAPPMPSVPSDEVNHG